MITQGSIHNSIRLLRGSWRNWSNSSVNRKIVAGSLTFSLLTLGVKALGALREAVSAAIFGLGDELDAFYVAFTIASFVIITIGSALQTAYIPLYLKTKKEEGESASQALFSEVITVCFITLVGIVIVLAVALPYILPVVVSGFSVEKAKLTYRLIIELSPLMILGGLSLTATAVLNAEEDFKITAILPGLTTISLLATLFFLANRVRIHALTIGLLVGAVLELCFLASALRRRNLKLVFRRSWQGRSVWGVIRNAVPIAGALALSGLMPLVDQSFAAKLNTGDVAALGLGFRIISLVLTLFATAVTTVVFPYFSKLALEKDWHKLRRVFYTNIGKFILPITVLSSVSVCIFSDLFVRLFFQRGAFTSQNTSLVAAIQAVYALQIPAYVIYSVSLRFLNAIYSNAVVAVISLVGLINNFWLNYYLAPIMGVKGIALSTSLVYAIAMIITLVIIELELKKREG